MSSVLFFRLLLTASPSVISLVTGIARALVLSTELGSRYVSLVELIYDTLVLGMSVVQ